MLYGIMCQMLARNPDEERPIRMHGVTFGTPEARDAEMATLRRQNLPFNMQPIDLPDYGKPEADKPWGMVVTRKLTADQLKQVIEHWLGLDCDWGDFEKRLRAAISEPHVGDGTGDAAIAIGEHAFRFGFRACQQTSMGALKQDRYAAEDKAWDAYDTPEHIKELG